MHRPGLAHFIILGLMGFALATYAAGTGAVIAEALHSAQGLQHAVLFCIGAALAVGLMLPERWAALCDHFAGRATPADLIDPAFRAWRRATGAMVVAGLAMMLFYFGIPWVGDLFHALIEGFHWTPMTLSFLEWGLVATVTVLPGVAFGLTLACIHHLGAKRRLRLAPAWGGAATGILCGWALLDTLARFPRPWTIALSALVLMLTGLYDGRLRTTLGTAVPHPQTPDPVSTPRAGAIAGVIGFTTVMYLTLWSEFDRLTLVQGAVAQGLTAWIVGVMLPVRWGWLTIEKAVIGSVGGLAAAMLLLGQDLARGGSHLTTCAALCCWWPMLGIGAAVGRLADRVDRQSAATITGCLAAGAGCAWALTLPNHVVVWGPRAAFSLIAIVWLVGTVGIARQRVVAPALATGLALVGACALPGQATGWGAARHQLHIHSMGDIVAVTSLFEGERVLSVLRGIPPAAERRSGLDVTMPWRGSLDDMVRRLLLLREHCAVIVVHFDADAAGYLTSPMKRGLTREAGRKLQPDGVFAVCVRGESEGLGIEGWPEPVQDEFASTELLPPGRAAVGDGWTLLGFRGLRSAAQAEP